MTNKIRRAIRLMRENKYLTIATALIIVGCFGLAVAATSMDYGVKDLTPLARTLMSFIGLAVAAASVVGAKMALWRVEDAADGQR
jgi:hypothetical protein